MKKKTYKSMLNRLYREVKKRQEAEKRIMIPMNVSVSRRKIDTIKIAKRIRNDEMMNITGAIEYAKKDMAHEIAMKLLENGYFFFKQQYVDPITDSAVIECRIDVTMPNRWD